MSWRTSSPSLVVSSVTVAVALAGHGRIVENSNGSSFVASASRHGRIADSAARDSLSVGHDPRQVHAAALVRAVDRDRALSLQDRVGRAARRCSPRRSGGVGGRDRDSEGVVGGQEAAARIVLAVAQAGRAQSKAARSSEFERVGRGAAGAWVARAGEAGVAPVDERCLRSVGAHGDRGDLPGRARFASPPQRGAAEARVRGRGQRHVVGHEAWVVASVGVDDRPERVARRVRRERLAHHARRGDVAHARAGMRPVREASVEALAPLRHDHAV